STPPRRSPHRVPAAARKPADPLHPVHPRAASSGAFYLKSAAMDGRLFDFRDHGRSQKMQTDHKTMEQAMTSSSANDAPARLALVTGGLGGLGTEICRQLAKAGRRVVAADLPASESRLTGFRAAVAEFGNAIGREAMDVSDHAACAALIGRLEREHGGVDILVNAAGITRDASLRKMTPTQWHELMRVNLDGLF